jgi:Cof subfamily protein (haloacid dehalogenase superfamily)
MQNITSIDLIAIDIDGTLLNSQGGLSTGARAAIDKARDQGVQVVIVSGRNRVGLLQVMELVDLELPYIGSGGAYIANPATDEVIQETPVPRATVEQVLAIARKAEAAIFIEANSRLFAEADPHLIAEIQPLAQIDVVFTENILQAFMGDPQKIVMIKDPDSLADLEAEIRQKVANINLSYSSPVYLEVTKQGVNKGSALIQLAHYLGIPLPRVAAIGDERNDLSMFEVAGLAIAMGNASAEVRAAADLIAPDNDEGGLSWAIHRILQSRSARLA